MVIPSGVLQQCCDRVSKQVELLAAAVTSASAAGTGLFYPKIHAGIPVTGLFRTEDDLISSANALDTSKLTNATVLPNIYRDFVNDLNTHASNESFTDLNTLLSGVGINVDPDFDEAYYQVRSAHLWGENVFADALVTLATVDFTGSGIASFSDGSAMGSGSHAATSATNRAAAMLHAKVTSAGGIGGTNVILDVRLTNENNVSTSRNVTIPSGSALNAIVSVGTSGTDFFRDVTNVVVAGGTNGDQVKIINQYPERVHAL